jgi:hypothetical protein
VVCSRDRERDRADRVERTRAGAGSAVWFSSDIPEGKKADACSGLGVVLSLSDMVERTTAGASSGVVRFSSDVVEGKL